MPKIKGEATSPVTIRIPAVDRDRIDELVTMGRFSNRSEVIARAISDWLAHEEYKATVSGSVISEISTNPAVLRAIREVVDSYLATKKL